MKKLCAIEDFRALEKELSRPGGEGVPTIVIPASTCSQASGANDLIRIAKRKCGVCADVCNFNAVIVE
jgi:hypothetical protein